MPRQLITIQVGQCGNQVGYRFWDLLLKQHSQNNKLGIYDQSLSSFFKNTQNQSKLPIGSKINQLKARAVIVDMQEGVTNQIKKSQLSQIFQNRNFINDVSGAGNNWAHGYYQYGRLYQNKLYENINRVVEQCDSLQSFFLIHSLAGGTGSGLGTRILTILQQKFPDVFRFTASIFPSRETTDVVTAPYNSLFSLNKLMEHADCTLPIDNQALINIVESVNTSNKQKQTKEQSKGRGKAYDQMNNIIANLLSNLTCSMRFQGILNVDFNQITMNLVPYPDLHFLIASIAPLYNIADPRLQPRKFDQIFDDIYDKKYQLIESDPISRKYLAMGLILRGKVSFTDVNNNIKRLRKNKNLNFIQWNTQGFKYGICNTPPINQNYSLLCLANNTCIRDKFSEMHEKYYKMYKKQFSVHNYIKYMQKQQFDEVNQNVKDLIMKYDSLQNYKPQQTKRLSPLYI